MEDEDGKVGLEAPESDEDKLEAEAAEADGDLFAEGYDMALSQCHAIVHRAYRRICGGGELRAGDLERLLSEIDDLGEE